MNIGKKSVDEDCCLERKNGSSNALADNFTKGVMKNGHSVVEPDVAYMGAPRAYTVTNGDIST